MNLRHLLVVPISLFSAAISCAQSPVEQFKDGPRSTFSSNGHAKSEGLNISIQYPQTWTAREGQRPHVLQLIQNTSGDANFSIGVKRLAASGERPPTTSQIEGMISQEALAASIPEGGRLLDYGRVTLDNQAAAMIAYIAPAERAGVTVISYTQA